MMDLKRPKTISVIAWFGIISSICGMIDIFNKNNNAVIVLGYILQGNVYKIYYITLAILLLILSIGLLKMKYWGYYGTIINNLVTVIVFTLNLYLITNGKLINTGWKVSENYVINYKYFIILEIILFTGINLILLKYRHMFKLIKRKDRLTTG